MHQDHEARIVKLEKQAQDLSVGLQSLSQQMTSENAALKVWFSDKLDQRLEDWRRENDRKLEDWRKENDRKLEDWRQGFGRKLDGLRGDMDKKFMWMIGLVVTLMIGLYFR